MSAKHSALPWAVTTGSNTPAKSRDVFPAGKEQRAGNRICRFPLEVDHVEEQLANIRLVLHSGELLAEVKRQRRIIDELFERFGHTPSPSDQVDLARADLLIRKAEGRD